ncbi:MAG TPA: prolyl oligopeptidase family serine peptidase [Phycisphaerae bacterium]|nr:prolyl oligopeptidase family serine peptidase [Phycisphaerae bacterium]
MNKHILHLGWVVLMVSLSAAAPPKRDPYPPPSGSPGDEMIHKYLSHLATKMEADWLVGTKEIFGEDAITSREDWEKARVEWKREYFHMLGLDPMPPRTPLNPTITGTIQRDGYVVDLLHFQSRPRLYVTANLYRPAKVKAGERLPAVLYVCGHSGMGRSGNKTAYQSHGIWFAKHGYVCLTLDSLQLGEIGATHHGTYRYGRWWWHSRGYTPAGVECLNGMRGIDYLISRDDVDASRIAVTGISGGGAATFWIAAADERARIAVPVSGMADLECYVNRCVINGHCDCMFLYNTFQWPWTRIAALIAPRPLLLANSDADPIFPMYANDRVINRLERVYSLFGASGDVDALVSVGGHAYRQDLRAQIYRFINTHLKNDPRPVTDSEEDLVEKEGNKKKYPIEPEKLRVFPQESDFPKDELNTTIDEHFVPVASVPAPAEGKFDEWKAGLQAELKRIALRGWPQRVPAGKPLPSPTNAADERLESQEHVEVRIRRTDPGAAAGKEGAQSIQAVKIERIVLVVTGEGAFERPSEWVRSLCRPGDAVYLLAPRGVGATRWTRKNPPNYVERSHALLGRTVDTGRVWDVAATARCLRARHPGELPVVAFGEGSDALLAAYAGLWEPEIVEVILRNPPLSHMDPAAPQFLNILRVCDVPDMLGMLAPRPLTIYHAKGQDWAKVAKIYAAAGAADKLKLHALPVE